jgi:hypothetical protein
MPDRGPSFRSFVADIGTGGGARLDFVHAFLPHVPWNLLPSGHHYDEGSDNGISPYDYSWDTAEAARVGRERHILQTQFADRLIGQLLDHLEASPRFADTLLVVTADHGVAFDAKQPLRFLTAENSTEVAWSPLFIKTPGRSVARVDDRNAESIDVLPTVADILGAKLRSPVDGRSLLGPARRSSTKQLVAIDQDRIPTDGDGHITLDGAAGFRRLLARPPAYDGVDPLGPVRTGGFADVVGRRVSELAEGDPVTGSVALEPSTLDVRPSSSEVPVMVRATVDDSSASEVALVADGVVVGTYRLDPNHRARFVVPEEAVPPGRHELELVALERRARAPLVRPFRSG